MTSVARCFIATHSSADRTADASGSLPRYRATLTGQLHGYDLILTLTAGLGAALFFGFITQMASQLQTLNTPMPSQFLLILPYVATIIAVAGLVGRVRAPAADGIPFEKE